MDPAFRLLAFTIKNEKPPNTYSKKEDSKQFIIQIFGMDEQGKTYSVFVEGFQPFFYVKLTEHKEWNESMKRRFLDHITSIIGNYYSNSITDCTLVKKKKLYGFDAGNGLPASTDYRDLLYMISEGEQKMDKTILDKKLNNTRIIMIIERIENSVILK